MSLKLILQGTSQKEYDFDPVEAAREREVPEYIAKFLRDVQNWLDSMSESEREMWEQSNNRAVPPEPIC